MKRCTYCFRYWFGQPQYCPRCDRTFDRRICERGHLNARDVNSCTSCRSPCLSIPAPVGRWLSTVAVWAVRGVLGMTVVLLALTFGVGLFVPLDWPRLGSRLVLLVVMTWIVYGATLVLPGPITRAVRPTAD